MPQSPGPPDTRPSLLARLRDLRDRPAWEEFVRAYGPPVFRFCTCRGLADSDAADVSQDILTQVALSIRTFQYDPKRGRFRDWLWAVVRSKLARFARASGGDPRVDPDGLAAPAVEAEWATEFNASLVRVALDRIRGHFETHTWRAFELSWAEGRPAPAVAAELGLPVAQVYVAKSRVLGRLRNELRALCDDVPHLADGD